MDKTTQAAAANAEESVPASEEIKAQAEQMKVYAKELATLTGGVEASQGKSVPAVYGQPE